VRVELPQTITNNGGVPTHDNDHQQIDRAAAGPAAESFSYPADDLSWDRPGPDVDRPGLVCRPAGTHRQQTAVAFDQTPQLDTAGRFVHACFNCGREPSSAPASTGVPASSAHGKRRAQAVVDIEN